MAEASRPSCHVDSSRKLRKRKVRGEHTAYLCIEHDYIIIIIIIIINIIAIWPDFCSHHVKGLNLNKMALRRSGRPKVASSYKNTCGAPAPRTQICLSANPAPKKPVPKSVTTHNATDGGNLTYTVSGERLTPGAVSCISHLLMDCTKVES
jgi:hypothetical protein